jgi:zinc transporter ZupT
VEFFEHHFRPPDCGGGRRLDAGGGETIWVRVYVAGFFFVGVLGAIGLDKCVDAMFAKQEDLSEGDSEAKEHLHSHDSHQVSSLERISFVTFLALTIHNFPEGLATFFGGGTGSFAVPVAIGMHNIPEGMAIAVPFYQSSGSVWGAVKNTFLAGLAQPIGAAFGWFLIAICRLEGLPSFVFGAVYALTAGVMVCVSIMELLPEAFAGATPMFVSLWAFAGFALMECSLICLSASGA